MRKTFSSCKVVKLLLSDCCLVLCDIFRPIAKKTNMSDLVNLTLDTFRKYSLRCGPFDTQYTLKASENRSSLSWTHWKQLSSSTLRSQCHQSLAWRRPHWPPWWWQWSHPPQLLGLTPAGGSLDHTLFILLLKVPKYISLELVQFLALKVSLKSDLFWIQLGEPLEIWPVSRLDPALAFLQPAHLISQSNNFSRSLAFASFRSVNLPILGYCPEEVAQQSGDKVHSFPKHTDLSDLSS